MRCIPLDCEYCLPWGAGVPGKTRCTKPPFPEGYRFRFSTTLGGPCVIAKELERGEQTELFPCDTPDEEEM